MSFPWIVLLIYVMTVFAPLIVYGVAFIPSTAHRPCSFSRTYASAAVWTPAGSSTPSSSAGGGFHCEGQDWLGDECQAVLSGAATLPGVVRVEARGTSPAVGFVSSTTLERPSPRRVPTNSNSRKETAPKDGMYQNSQRYAQSHPVSISVGEGQEQEVGALVEEQDRRGGYESAIMACSLAGDWAGVVALFERGAREEEERGGGRQDLIQSKRMTKLFIRVCAKTSEGGKALSGVRWLLLRQGGGGGTEAALEEEDLDLALEACSSGSKPQAEAAVAIIREAALQAEMAPSVRGLSWAILSCARGGKLQEALMLLSQLEKEGGKEGRTQAAALYAPLVQCCCNDRGEGAARTALLLLKRMEVAQIPRSRAVYTSVLAACEEAGMWEAALDCLGKMEESGEVLDTTCFNHAIGATCKGGAWDQGVQVLRRLESHPALGADTRTCHIILQALAKAGEWRAALRLLEISREREGGSEVDVSLMEAAVDICIKQGRATEGLTVVLDRMARARDSGAVDSEESRVLALALRATTRIRRTRCPAAADLVDQVVQRRTPSPSSSLSGGGILALTPGAYESLIQILEEDERTDVAQDLFRQACAQGVFPAFTARKLSSLVQPVDLRGMPVGVARAALRLLLIELAATHPPSLRQQQQQQQQQQPSPLLVAVERPLVLITGTAPEFKQGIITFFRDCLGPARVNCRPMPLNPGRLVVTADELTRFITTSSSSSQAPRHQPSRDLREGASSGRPTPSASHAASLSVEQRPSASAAVATTEALPPLAEL